MAFAARKLKGDDMKVVIIKIRDKDGGDIVAVDEIRIPVATDELVAELKVVDAPPRARRAERNPLHPQSLRLSDLRVGMKIRVHYTGDCPWARSYSATVVGKPTTNDLGFQTIPIVTDDLEYKLGFAADMGLAPSRCGGVWNRVWYVTAE